MIKNTDKERRAINLSVNSSTKASFIYRYSTFNRLLRIISLCLRFIFIVTHPEDKRFDPLQPEDLDNII